MSVLLWRNFPLLSSVFTHIHSFLHSSLPCKKPWLCNRYLEGNPKLEHIPENYAGYIDLTHDQPPSAGSTPPPFATDLGDDEESSSSARSARLILGIVSSNRSFRRCWNENIYIYMYLCTYPLVLECPIPPLSLVFLLLVLDMCRRFRFLWRCCC